jgi:nucleoside-diphosphate-sugar epimerase
VNALLERGSITTSDGEQREIDEIVVADIGPPAQPFPEDSRLITRYGDFSEADAANQLVTGNTAAVFHLAAIVSGEAEQDFDKGMRVNLEGTKKILEACRHRANCPRLVFASSVAVYGGDMPDVLDDTTPLTPQTSYGSQKAMGEMLVNDYSRKGFVDGRALRLPTIVVRPGKPNAAASSFASAIMREPLQGVEVNCPVSPKTGVWLLSPRKAVACFLHASDLAPEAWGASRSVALPGMTVTVEEMMAALSKVAGKGVAARVHFEPDAFIEKIVYGWATRFTTERAEVMGFRADERFEDVIEAFIEDDLGGDFVK